MANVLEFRFGIKSAAGEKSAIWKVFGTKAGDLYLTQRTMAKVHKYSFHQSGICRYAFVAERRLPPGVEDRAMLKWKRTKLHGAGTGYGTLVATIAFPTSFLSRAYPTIAKSVKWIDAAPSGMATQVEIFFTSESEDDVINAFRQTGQRQLIGYAQPPKKPAFGICWAHINWDDRELRMPGGEVNDLIFSPSDPFDTGRPVRLTTHSNPTDGEAIHIQELGGYAIPNMDNVPIHISKSSE